MVHIFVDFEMNIISRELFDEIKNCHMEIIEIGAVALNDNYEIIDTYKRYIKPQYNDRIMPRYVELTGITDEMVENADEFETCFRDFLAWCGSFEGIYAYEIFSWSTSDLEQLRRELIQKKIKRNKTIKWMLRNWFDYQKEFSRVLGYGGVMSLDRAVEGLKLEFSGQHHDALCDAKNTAMIYCIANKIDTYEKYIVPLKEEIKRENEEKLKLKKQEEDKSSD